MLINCFTISGLIETVWSEFQHGSLNIYCLKFLCSRCYSLPWNACIIDSIFRSRSRLYSRHCRVTMGRMPACMIHFLWGIYEVATISLFTVFSAVVPLLPWCVVYESQINESSFLIPTLTTGFVAMTKLFSMYLLTTSVQLLLLEGDTSSSARGLVTLVTCQHYLHSKIITGRSIFLAFQLSRVDKLQEDCCSMLCDIKIHTVHIIL